MKGSQGMGIMDERFDARMVISYITSQQGITVADLGVAPVVVLSWNPIIVRTLAQATGAQRSEHWRYGKQYPLYNGEEAGQHVSFACVLPGAPATVMVMEEMIACGARVFIALGYAGSLQPSAPVGTFLMPTSCICEEGTSAHYPGGDAIGPSQRLAEVIQNCCRAEKVKLLRGPLWTTDAPYRELVSKIDAYRQQGVLGVDMETSAMYALGRFRGVDVCNLLMVSDELWCEWRVAFASPELRDAERRAVSVIRRCLGQNLIE